MRLTKTASSTDFPMLFIIPKPILPAKSNYNQESSYKRDLFSDGLIFKYRTEDFELISTTSYQYYDGVMAVDQDFTADSIYFFEIGDNQNMWSQEFVAKSLNNERYNWLFGAYGFAQTMDQKTFGDLYRSNMQQDIRSKFDISGFALFHQSTVNNFLIEKLTLTAGIRLRCGKRQAGLFNGNVGWRRSVEYSNFRQLRRNIYRNSTEGGFKIRVQQ